MLAVKPAPGDWGREGRKGGGGLWKLDSRGGGRGACT